jgi:hypothetical protein
MRVAIRNLTTVNSIPVLTSHLTFILTISYNRHLDLPLIIVLQGFLYEMLHAFIFSPIVPLASDIFRSPVYLLNSVVTGELIIKLSIVQ